MAVLHRRDVRLFLTAEGCAYLWLLLGDLLRDGAGTVGVKYGSIALCLFFALYQSRRGGDRLTAAALLLTLGADSFLLLLGEDYVLGLLLFCGAQGLYLLRLLRENGGRGRWLFRAALAALALLLLGRLGLLDPLNFLAALYFTTFLCSTLQSFWLKGPRPRLFSAGLALYLCCDICVGIFNRPALFPPWAAPPAAVGMWLFYLPGQVCIALSALPNNEFKR